MNRRRKRNERKEKKREKLRGKGHPFWHPKTKKSGGGRLCEAQRLILKKVSLVICGSEQRKVLVWSRQSSLTIEAHAWKTADSLYPHPASVGRHERPLLSIRRKKQSLRRRAFFWLPELENLPCTIKMKRTEKNKKKKKEIWLQSRLPISLLSLRENW